MPYASAPVIWYLVGSSVIVAVALVAVPFVGLPVLEARLRRNGPKYGLTNVGTPQPRHSSGNAALRAERRHALRIPFGPASSEDVSDTSFITRLDPDYLAGDR
jgi:hypothetical protein